ncbi:putative membrane-anchored protein [Bradyrhizobium sp. LB7.2]
MQLQMSHFISLSDSDGLSLAAHGLRSQVLSELHARPFTPLLAPSRVLHFAFDTSEGRAQIDRANLAELCRTLGLAIPSSDQKYHHAQLGVIALRWEQHSEFTTYTWETPSDLDVAPFTPRATSLASSMSRVPQPGPLLVALDLHLLPEQQAQPAPELSFDRASLVMAENSDGKAVYATDFKPDSCGFIRILVLDRGLGRERAGALVQRIIEVETYRTFALLGLPEARRLAIPVGLIEKRLAEVMDEMRKANDIAGNRRLLNELTELAAEVEAGAAASGFRFGASRAYEEIVQQRLQTIGERKLDGFPTWSSFLARRMAPAMRTCATLDARQATLSVKLSRAADLLRTRVDVELEQQNQELLQSMNARTRLQLRLQTTVEGLSVAAITYYVVGLFWYFVKAAHDSGHVSIEPNLMMAAFVPIAALMIWSTVRRIRRKHANDEAE